MERDLRIILVAQWDKNMDIYACIFQAIWWSIQGTNKCIDAYEDMCT